MNQGKKNPIINGLQNLFSYQPHQEYNFSIPETNEGNQSFNTPLEFSYENDPISVELPKNIFPTLSVNLEVITSRYNTMINSDVVVREFSLTAKNKEYKAFLLYIDGMVDTTSINHFVLDPLMLRNIANTYQNPENEVVKEAVSSNIVVRRVKKFDLSSYILNHLVPQNSVKKLDTFDDVASSVNSGNCALFVDTLNIVFDIDVKGFKQRSLGKPENEMVIRGSQEAFTENIRTNTSLLRRFINNENLIVENLEVGNLTKTKCAVCYMENIANNDLVAEVKYRLNNIDVDSIISSRTIRTIN